MLAVLGLVTQAEAALGSLLEPSCWIEGNQAVLSVMRTCGKTQGNEVPHGETQSCLL